MKIYRKTKTDVSLVAGPKIGTFPSIGARAMGLRLAQAGLDVSIFGDADTRVLGVVPQAKLGLESGGSVFIEDAQERVHEVVSRSVVKFAAPSEYPLPFSGMHSGGLLPLSTAERLLLRAIRPRDRKFWAPVLTGGQAVAILGTGNRALRLGSRLLESGAAVVYCIENVNAWAELGLKRHFGWEVEARRFRRLGGKIVEGMPIGLEPVGPRLWVLRIQEPKGVRRIELYCVVSAGPFAEEQDFKEYPAGSLLFEIPQTALFEKSQDVEGWIIEKERAKWVAGKILKSLKPDVGSTLEREEIETLIKRARGRLKRWRTHHLKPYDPHYEGKWLSDQDQRQLRAFSGIPDLTVAANQGRMLAHIECIEEVPCNLCLTVCPEGAIQIGKVPRPTDGRPILNTALCTGCGLCIAECPSRAIVGVKEDRGSHKGELRLPLAPEPPPDAYGKGSTITLLNRIGDELGQGRVLERLENGLKVEAPTHLLRDARGFKAHVRPKAEDPTFLAQWSGASSKEGVDWNERKRIEFLVNGERRSCELVHEHESRNASSEASLTAHLFELGLDRVGDAQYCPDGSCGLCQVVVDGNRVLACQTQVRSGMGIEFEKRPFEKEREIAASSQQTDPLLCPCLGITYESLLKQMESSKPATMEALLQSTQLAEGRCHGQICLSSVKTLFQKHLEQHRPQARAHATDWIDWRFPWSDWRMD